MALRLPGWGGSLQHQAGPAGTHVPCGPQTGCSRLMLAGGQPEDRAGEPSGPLGGGGLGDRAGAGTARDPFTQTGWKMRPP